MGQPNPEAIRTLREVRRSLQGVAGFLGLSVIVLLSGCAQFDQLMGKVMGKGTDPVQPAPAVPTQRATPTPPAEPDVKTPDGVQPAKAATESLPQAPVAAPARPPPPAASAASEPEPEIKSSEQDKTLVEKEQPSKEKKSRAASDRKSKKSAKPKPSTEDDFLPPIPPPSKPAAIGGSGG